MVPGCVQATRSVSYNRRYQPEALSIEAKGYCVGLLFTEHNGALVVRPTHPQSLSLTVKKIYCNNNDS